MDHGAWVQAVYRGVSRHITLLEGSLPNRSRTVDGDLQVPDSRL